MRRVRLLLLLLLLLLLVSGGSADDEDDADLDDDGDFDLDDEENEVYEIQNPKQLKDSWIQVGVCACCLLHELPVRVGEIVDVCVCVAPAT